MPGSRFFDGGPTGQSLVKIAIVEKYFGAWSTVMTRRTRGAICYADFYAGEGEYEDGTPSVPLRVLRMALEDVELRHRLLTVFNDRDSGIVDVLRRNIAHVPGVESLSCQPIVLDCEVGSDDALLLQALPEVPTLTLLDPTGYKGLSIELVDALTTGFGRECVMFFNMNRIRGAVSNPAVEALMRQLFGEDWFPIVRERVAGLERVERELAILETMAEALRERGMEFVLPFRFRDARGTRTSHHLVHVCRHVKGYEIMKDIMARESSSGSQGVASFEYNPADERYPLLFEYARPLEHLGRLVIEEFAGQTLRTDEVYQRHHVGTPYVKKNYKDALTALEEAGMIRANPPAEDRRSGTFADSVVVRFPPREQG